MDIKTLSQIKQSHNPIRNVNITQRENLSRLDKFAITITNRVGTMGFFLIILTWTITWLTWNLFAPEELRFDPYPAFVFWLFISNMIQILLMPLLLVGQNLQGRHNQARAEADYEIDLQADEKIDTILLRLEDQDNKIDQIAALLEKKKK